MFVRVFFKAICTPSEGIEPPSREPESHVISIKLRGQLTYLLYKWNENNSSYHFEA